MKTIHISYGGPDRRIRDATGKVWRFEMHPHSGPAVQDDDGELADKQPGERSPFWVAEHRFPAPFGPEMKKPAIALIAGFLYLTRVWVVGRTRFELVTNGLKGQLCLYESTGCERATN